MCKFKCGALNPCTHRHQQTIASGKRKKKIDAEYRGLLAKLWPLIIESTLTGEWLRSILRQLHLPRHRLMQVRTHSSSGCNQYREYEGAFLISICVLLRFAISRLVYLEFVFWETKCLLGCCCWHWFFAQALVTVVWQHASTRRTGAHEGLIRNQYAYELCNHSLGSLCVIYIRY